MNKNRKQWFSNLTNPYFIYNRTQKRSNVWTENIYNFKKNVATCLQLILVTCNISVTWLSIKRAPQNRWAVVCLSAKSWIWKLWNILRIIFFNIKLWRLWISHHLQYIISNNSQNLKKCVCIRDKAKNQYSMPMIFRPTEKLTFSIVLAKQITPRPPDKRGDGQSGLLLELSWKACISDNMVVHQCLELAACTSKRASKLKGIYRF